MATTSLRIALLTFYYPPDLSAGSYRATALVNGLVELAPAGAEIDVITTTPNRYATFSAGADASPHAQGRVQIDRFPVTRHRSGLVDQSLSFSSFAARVLREVRGRRYDVVVATSSRMFTGVLGTAVAKATGARLYLDVRDLFVDTLRELFRGSLGVRAMLPAFRYLENYTVRRAARVNLVSRGFLQCYASRYPDQDFANFGNGIDPEFLEFDYRRPRADAPRIVLYAGNIGLGQGIDQIVPAAAQRLGPEWIFRVIGDGGRREALVRRLRADGIKNVVWVPPVDREALKLEYREADYLLLHVNDAPVLEGVIPSKLFEYAATGKPIVAGIKGHGRRLIEEQLHGVAVFDPGDVDGLVRALGSLPADLVDRDEFTRRHDRRQIMRAMACDVLSLVPRGRHQH